MPRLGQRTDPIARFVEKVDFTDACWNWTASVNPDGYGSFTVTPRKPVKAHRYAWETFVGPIPDGLVIDHLCRNPRCVNPDHLEPVTQRENVNRGQHVQKSHCINGHPRTPENVYRFRNGRSKCRVCALEQSAAKREGRPYKGAYTRPDVPMKTHCLRGHAFDEANTMISGGVRYCRTCDRIRKARYAAQKASA